MGTLVSMVTILANIQKQKNKNKAPHSQPKKKKRDVKTTKIVPKTRKKTHTV